MDNQGWIKLYRSLTDWEWYEDPNTMRVFIHCLLMANYKDNKYRGQLVKRGSFLTSREKLSKELSLGERPIRTAIKHLEESEELTVESSKKGSVITVNNYERYQISDQQTDQQNNFFADQQVTTNKNEKKYKQHTQESVERVSDEVIENYQTIKNIYPNNAGTTKAFNIYIEWITTGRDVCGRNTILTNRQIYCAVNSYLDNAEERGQEHIQRFDNLMEDIFDYIPEEER